MVASVIMDKLEGMDGDVSSASGGFMQLSSSFKGSDEDSSAFYERFFEETDSFFDELNGRLMVSRMVNDSVIKGMVNAVSEEAAEIVTSKEVEIARLSEKLRLRELEISRLEMALQHNDQKFQNCSEKKSISSWEWEFQEEINNAVIQSFIENLREQSEGKLEAQRREYLGSINKSWVTRIDEITKLREELDVISKSILAPDPGQLISHGSHEIFEEAANNRKKESSHWKILGNNGTPALEKCAKSEDASADIFDSPQLKDKSREELISFFKTEITKLKRNHESKVGELTEEYFSLHRKMQKEWGSSPFRKDKEFDSIRKRIPEIILKLDSIIEENGKLSLFYKDYENLCSSNNSLLSENLQLKGLLLEKKKEVKCLSSQISDSVNKLNLHSLTEANFLKHIKKLKSETVDSKMEFMIREGIYMGFFRDLIGKIKCSMDDSDIETLYVQEVYEIIYREALRAMESKLSEKEKNLCLEIREKEQLKEKLVSISKLLEEKEKLVSEVESKLRIQKDNCEFASRELKGKVDKLNWQDGLLIEKSRELDSVKGRLEGVLQKIANYKVELDERDRRLKVMEDDLREAKLQITVLDGIIQEKQQTISSKIANEREQRELMQSFATSFQELSTALSSFECRVAENIKSNNSRLEMVTHHIKPLVQGVQLLRKRASIYEQGFNRKCFDLIKAEKEVDLLGDQVDGYKILLNHICTALDHYSLVLQHYPGGLRCWTRLGVFVKVLKTCYDAVLDPVTSVLKSFNSQFASADYCARVMEIRKLILSVLPEEQSQPSSKKTEKTRPVLSKLPQEANSCRGSPLR